MNSYNFQVIMRLDKFLWCYKNIFTKITLKKVSHHINLYFFFFKNHNNQHNTSLINIQYFLRQYLYFYLAKTETEEKCKFIKLDDEFFWIITSDKWLTFLLTLGYHNLSVPRYHSITFYSTFILNILQNSYITQEPLVVLVCSWSSSKYWFVASFCCPFISSNVLKTVVFVFAPSDFFNRFIIFRSLCLLFLPGSTQIIIKAKVIR